MGLYPPPIVGKECIININYKCFCIMFECLISLYILFRHIYLSIYLICFATYSIQEGMGWAWSNMGPHSPGRSGYKGFKINSRYIRSFRNTCFRYFSNFITKEFNCYCANASTQSNRDSIMFDRNLVIIEYKPKIT